MVKVGENPYRQGGYTFRSFANMISGERQLSRNPRAVRLGTAMRLARNAIGLSQAQLAERIGHKHKSDIGAWEQGDRFPSEEVLARIDRELHQDGHLLSIAGYALEDSTITDEIQAVIDAHTAAMLRDINRILGRD